MQRSFSSSAVDHQYYLRSSTATCRHLPLRLVYNNHNDYYSSDTDVQHKTYPQRVSSASNITSTSRYRILPIRYSSVDRILPSVTANKRGIEVRINFHCPHRHHKHRHHRKHMTREHQHYGSCPVLDGNSQNSTSIGPSNITCIETRSIVRNHSKSMNIPKSPITNTRIKHIPLNSNCLSTRVIREEEEC